jgi:Protein of unknown function (DUF3551)
MRLVLGLAALALIAAATPAAAAEWCGFHTKSHSVFKCGFSSYAECHAQIGKDKDAACRLNPSFAALQAPGQAIAS